MHPTANCFTWTRWDGSLSSRIDLFGCPYAWVSSVSSCDILPFPFFDHCAVLLSLSVPDVIPPGPGLWKLNTSVLDDDNYVSLVTNFWSGWRNQIPFFPSPSNWWEKGKSEIKGLTISFCCDRSRTSTESRQVLSRLIDHLKRRIDAGHSSSLEPYHTALANLARFNLEAARGAQVRSRIRWVEEGESSSANFFDWRKSLELIAGFLHCERATVLSFLTLTFCVRPLRLSTLPFLLLLFVMLQCRIPCSVTSLPLCLPINLISVKVLLLLMNVA